MMMWYRYCYLYPTWPSGHCKHKDGYARGHWTQNLAACQALVNDVIAHGGKAFIEREKVYAKPHGIE